MHAADTAVVRRTREAEPGRWLDYMAAKLAAAGAPEEHLAPLRAARATGAAAQPARPARRAARPRHRPRRTARPAGPPAARDLDARATPPAMSASIWRRTTPAGLPGHGRLFSGDHLLPGITPHIGLYEDPDDATRHRPPRRLPRLPGTRRPARPRRGAARPPARVHRRRRPRTGAARPPRGPAHRPARPARRPRSPPGSSPSAWSGTAPGTQIPYGSRNIAVSEAEAHLRRLVKLGQAEAVPGQRSGDVPGGVRAVARLVRTRGARPVSAPRAAPARTCERVPCRAPVKGCGTGRVGVDHRTRSGEAGGNPALTRNREDGPSAPRPGPVWTAVRAGAPDRARPRLPPPKPPPRGRPVRGTVEVYGAEPGATVPDPWIGARVAGRARLRSIRRDPTREAPTRWPPWLPWLTRPL